MYAGYCLDFGDGAPPYLPFSEVIGRLTAGVPDVVSAVGADAHRAGPAAAGPADARRDVPAEESGPGPRRSLRRGARPAGGGRGARRRCCWSSRTSTGPTSPRGTCSASCSPGRSPATSPSSASYRTDDLHRRHPLRSQVAEWSRLRGVERMVLRPLAPEASASWCATCRRAELSEGDVARIVARADGNAFFVEELVNAGVPGRRLPDDLAGVLLVRLDRLDERGRELVRAASAGGRQVSHGLLAAVSGMPAEELEEALRQAVDAHVLVSGPHGYAFRHALLGEAVYDDLLPGERVRLHAAYVSALQAGRAAGTPAELARHARAAMDYDTAITASLQAGEDARAVGGPDEAAHHLQQAIELLSDPHRRPAVDVDRSKLAVQAAEALSASGRPGRGAALLRDQLAALGPDLPADARARMLSARAARPAHHRARRGPGGGVRRGGATAGGRGQRTACPGARRARPHPGLRRPLRGGPGGRPGRARPRRAAGPVGAGERRGDDAELPEALRAQGGGPGGAGRGSRTGPADRCRDRRAAWPVPARPVLRGPR